MGASEIRRTIRLAVSADVRGSVADVYRLIADYREGHPRIVPPEFFRFLRVEKGGYGAGTIFTVDLLSFGRTVSLRAHVTEPEPGRVLAETYADDSVTTFTVDPLGPTRSLVTIASHIRIRAGVIGFLQRLLTSRFLRRVYRAELELLDRQAQRSTAASQHTLIAPVLPRSGRSR